MLIPASLHAALAVPCWLAAVSLQHSRGCSAQTGQASDAMRQLLAAPKLTQTAASLAPRLLPTVNKNLFYASVLLQVDFYLSKATLKFPAECPANTYLFTMMGFGKHTAETAVHFIPVLLHFHPNRGCCSGHLPGYLVAGSEQAPACGQVSSAAWLSTGGPWAFLHVKIQLL